MEHSKTGRGFSITKFKDSYGKLCSLQKSSAASDHFIWLGVNDAEPKIMSRDAIRLGLREQTFDENDNGWIEFPIPKEVSLNTRMHLNRQQVQDLLPYLQRFAQTGEL